MVQVGRDDRYGFRHALLREVIYDDLLPGERAELHLRLARAGATRAEQRRPDGDPRRRRRPPLQRRGRPAAGARSAAVARRPRVERGGTPGAAAALLDRAWRSGRGSPNRSRWRGSTRDAAHAGGPRPRPRRRRGRTRSSSTSRRSGEVDEAPSRTGSPGARRNRLGALGDRRAEAARDGPRPGARPAAGVRPTPERARILEQKARFLLLQGRFAESRDAADEALRAAEAAGVDAAGSAEPARPLPLPARRERSAAAARVDRDRRRRATRRRPSSTSPTRSTSTVAARGARGRSRRGARASATRGSERVARGDHRLEIVFDLGDWASRARARPSRQRGQSGTTLANVRCGARMLALAEATRRTASELIEHPPSRSPTRSSPSTSAGRGAARANWSCAPATSRRRGEAAEKAIDQLEFCSDDAARMARLAAADAVEAEAAERARDLGDAAGWRPRDARRARRGADRGGGVRRPAALPRAARCHGARRARAGAGAAIRRPTPTRPPRWREAAGRTPPRSRCGDRAAARAAAATGTRPAPRRGLATAERLGAEWLGSRGYSGLAGRARLASDPAAGHSGDGRAGARRRAGAADEDPFGLTPRERQVLAALAEGATNREIAASLFMAEKTASVHVSRILAKLGVRSRTEAAAVAYPLGWLYGSGLVADLAARLRHRAEGSVLAHCPPSTCGLMHPRSRSSSGRRRPRSLGPGALGLRRAGRGIGTVLDRLG